MAKYLAIAKGYIDKKGMLEPGTEFEYAGKPSQAWMVPLDDAAREAFKKAGFKVAALPVPAAEEKPGEAKGKGKGKGAAGGVKSTGDQEVI